MNPISRNKTAATWNTWDVNCLNAVMKLPEMCEVRISIYDEEEKYLQEEMLWRNVDKENTNKAAENKNLKRFGYHHPYGKYFDIDLKYKGFIFNTEFASEGDIFVYKITPSYQNEKLRFFINVLYRWNPPGSICKGSNEFVVKSGIKEYKIDFVGNRDEATKINAFTQGFAFETSSIIYIRCNNEMSVEAMEEFIISRKKECMKELVYGNGILEECPEAVVKGLVWNTIYEPIKDRICTPVARTWCTGNGDRFGSYVLFDWDTFFAAILSSIQDKDLAYQQIFSIMQEITEGGFVPNFGAQRSSSYDRSQPPVGSYCILKVFRQFNEIKLLEENYEKLVVWNKWWMKHRDGNGDGLLEWGSDTFESVSKLGYEANNMQAAMYESGLDNSPMYDEVKYNKKTNTMELADVGLNALYALDCWALKEIALILGRKDDAEHFSQQYENMKSKINDELWNNELGIYCNKYWDGTFSTRLSPTNFYPLLAGIPSKEQAERLIKGHLLNEKEFWGEYVIPSISRTDEAFEDNDYWRGRIWGPMNFLVAECIKRYEYYDEAYAFAKKSLKLFMKEWKEENHIHENYNSITGDGDDKKNADAVYTWGALLGYVAISEFIEVQPWSGIRIGNLSGEEGGVENYCFGDSRYSVQCGRDGLKLEIDSKNILSTDVPVIITDFCMDKDSVSMKVRSKEQGKMFLNLPEAAEKISLVINGITKNLFCDESRIVTIDI
jgi:putative isomerase